MSDKNHRFFSDGAFHVHVLRGAAAQVRRYGVVQEEVVEQHAALGFIYSNGGVMGFNGIQRDSMGFNGV